MTLPPRVPRATYRVQLHSEFNFEKLAQIIPYLHKLGISDVYCSPIFQATPGSTHGYDVCDPNEVSADLGGKEGLLKVSALLQERSMGTLVDFVPNHMGIEGPYNGRWRDVLENGRLSRYATFFDIQWNPRQSLLQDRILLPLLSDFYGRVLEAGDIRIAYTNSAFWVCYGTLRFPLCPESYEMILKRLAWHKDPGSPLSQKLEALAEQFRTLPKPVVIDNLEEIRKRNHERDALQRDLNDLIQDESLNADLEQVLQGINGVPGNSESFDYLHQLLEEQHYRLAYWKTGTHEINYRRFFAVDSLVGLRMERQEVFDECHRLLKELIQEGVINGVRVDHIDGLWNPAQYLERLSYLTGSEKAPFYSLVEKILTEKEELPTNWMTNGTTGYDFAGHLINLFLASKSEGEFSRIYRDFAGMAVTPDEQAYQLKLYIMDDLFPNALDNFALELEERVKSDRRWRDWTVSDLRPAFSRIIACLSVYRTYRLHGQSPSPCDIEIIEKAVKEALRLNHSGDPLPYQFIKDIWLGRYPDAKAGEEMKLWAIDWISRLQQYTGAIMAKSMEDTFFYRYVRLFAANEVGHHPAEFGKPVSDFHEKNQRRLHDWPAAMLGTSTHDTKMSEDVRARLLALSEIPERWDTALHRWSKLNHPIKTLVNNVLAPDANEEYFLYQILLGAWPLDDSEVNAAFCDRIKQYMHKALAESKAHTDWANPDQDWLQACDKFIDTLLDRKASSLFWEDFLPFAHDLTYEGMKISLVQIALKLTCPGVPDFYQGTEIWDFSLVDPDNRRPVDYELRKKLIEGLSEAPIPELFESWKDGRIKMRLIQAILTYRREHPSLFLQGSYVPLKITGPQADRFIAFLRQEGDDQLLVIALRRMNEDGVTDLKTICQNMTLTFPEAPPAWRDLLTGREINDAATESKLETFFDVLPFSILATKSNPYK